MKILKILFLLFAVLFLTVLTQVGGLFLILCLPLYTAYKKTWARAVIFVLVYCSLSYFLVPPIAKIFGRVPLPVTSNNILKPLNYGTVLLNRHYVTPKMLSTIEHAADLIDKEYENTVTSYLDANFPFFNGFPLFPHLSHDDGEKLDLAFFYRDSNTEELVKRKAPSFIGYGVYEEPKEGEINTAAKCQINDYWQYSIMGKIIPQWNKKNYVLDEEITKRFITIITNQRAIKKVFIEPHLKTRFKLNSDKIRFHGCHAVRHDDHIHIQL